MKKRMLQDQIKRLETETVQVQEILVRKCEELKGKVEQLQKIVLEIDSGRCALHDLHPPLPY